jgi:hypothetical protein
MNVKLTMLAMLILGTMMGTIFIGNVSAQSSEIFENDEMVLATNSTSVMDTLSNTLTRVVNLVADIILAPFNAIATVFENWGANLSGWAGPIIAIFVIIVILVMVRIFSEFDEILDLNS